jgi:hypothetical protein
VALFSAWTFGLDQAFQLDAEIKAAQWRGVGGIST